MGYLRVAALRVPKLADTRRKLFMRELLHTRGARVKGPGFSDGRLLRCIAATDSKSPPVGCSGRAEAQRGRLQPRIRGDWGCFGALRHNHAPGLDIRIALSVVPDKVLLTLPRCKYLACMTVRAQRQNLLFPTGRSLFPATAASFSH